MKKTIITALLALICMTGHAKAKEVVWENPSAFMGAYNAAPAVKVTNS